MLPSRIAYMLYCSLQSRSCKRVVGVATVLYESLLKRPPSKQQKQSSGHSLTHSLSAQAQAQGHAISYIPSLLVYSIHPVLA